MSLVALAVPGVATTMAIEEAAYTAVARDGRFEIREYAPQVLAETLVTGSLEEAGKQAFNRLFRYISGANTARTNLAMTAPVTQEPGSVKIPMTAPVGQVATAISEQTRFEVKKQQIDMQPIRSLGEFTAHVRLTMDLVPEVKIIVHREGEAVEETAVEKVEAPAAEASVEKPEA